MTPQLKLIDFLLVFISGIIVSFTPCVYPLIPITLSAIVPKTQGSKVKGLYLSLIYVFGIAITYSILGLIAALTGSLFGKISSHPLSYFIFGFACIIFGFSMLEIFRFSIPQISLKRSFLSRGFISIFLFGLVSGLAVGPCTFPALGSILVYVGTRQNIILGVSLLFTFAFGLGFTLILAGTFAGLLLSLPKSGKWLLWVKKFCGVILILIGLYFLIKSVRLYL